MRVGVALGHGEEVLVVAIGSSSCGDTLEGDFGSKREFCYWLNTLRHWVRRFLLGKAHGN